MPVSRPIKVIMIVLDENLRPTEEYENFESQTEAGKTIGQSKGHISWILNPDRSQKTATDKRTGNTVTFVRADATEEETLEWLKEIENKKIPPVKVGMIVLNENLKPTGEYKIFESEAEAEASISKSRGTISEILNPEDYRKTTTDKITGNTVTFVRADATKKEILEWLKKVEKKHQPRKVNIVYVKSGKIKCLDSIREASRFTGVNTKTIQNDIKKKFKNPRKRYHKDTNEEIKFCEA